MQRHGPLLYTSDTFPTKHRHPDWIQTHRKPTYFSLSHVFACLCCPPMSADRGQSRGTRNQPRLGRPVKQKQCWSFTFSNIRGHKESLWWCRFAACSNGFRRCMATVQRCQPPKHKHEPTIWLCYRRICTLSKQASYASTGLNSNFCFWLRLLYWTDWQTLSTNFQHVCTKQTLTTQGALFALSFGVCVLVVTISLLRTKVHFLSEVVLILKMLNVFWTADDISHLKNVPKKDLIFLFWATIGDLVSQVKGHS